MDRVVLNELSESYEEEVSSDRFKSHMGFPAADYRAYTFGWTAGPEEPKSSLSPSIKLNNSFNPYTTQ